VLESGAHAVALVGSDLPALRASSVTRALALLREDPQSVILGPAVDGGYYLIAASHVPDLFENIEWGADLVLEHTRMEAGKAGIRLHLIESTFDIDGVADLVLLVRHATHLHAEAIGHRTRQWARERGITAGK
jgi:uncharacterized protein